MENLSNYSNDYNDNAEVSKLLTAETRFVEMEDIEKNGRDYALKQKTEFLVRESRDNPLEVLRNEVINERDEYMEQGARDMVGL
jgi:hypothetical protein